MYRHRHPANIARHDENDLGGRAADRVAAFMGSWRFIGIQSAVIVLWISMNVLAAVLRWDPYPFILLNLLFSTQAAYSAPILQLATNRQTEHDRVKAEHDYTVNSQALALLRHIILQQGATEAEVERILEEVRAL
jgi:uncharacterized membrane protein